MNFLDERLPQRFWDKVTPCPMSGCWLWFGYTAHGYGRVSLDLKPQQAHRVAYEALVGTIPDGLHIDHRCRVRCCVNPAHLEPVTSAENTRRGEAGINNARKTHCPQGHAYEGDNLFFMANEFRGGKSRACRLCKRTSAAMYRANVLLRRALREQPFAAGGSTRKESTIIEAYEPQKLLAKGSR